MGATKSLADIKTALGIDDTTTLDTLLSKAVSNEVLLQSEINNIKSMSVLPLPDTVKDKASELKARMTNIVIDESKGINYLMNVRMVILTEIVKALQNEKAKLTDTDQEITAKTVAATNMTLGGKDVATEEYSDNNLATAEAYSDTNLETAKAYSDTKLTEAETYADTKKSEAISTASADATTKADTAKSEAVSQAYTEMKSYVGLEFKKESNHIIFGTAVQNTTTGVITIPYTLGGESHEFTIDTNSEGMIKSQTLKSEDYTDTEGVTRTKYYIDIEYYDETKEHSKLWLTSLTDIYTGSSNDYVKTTVADGVVTVELTDLAKSILTTANKNNTYFTDTILPTYTDMVALKDDNYQLGGYKLTENEDGTYTLDIKAI